MARALSSAAAEALLIVLAVAVSVLLYLQLGSYVAEERQDVEPTVVKIDSVWANRTGIYAVIHCIRGTEPVESAALVSPATGTGAAAYLLPRPRCRPGLVYTALVVPMVQLPPGSYKLIVSTGSSSASAILRLFEMSPQGFAFDTFLRNETFFFSGEGYNATVNVTYQYDIYYRVRVRVYAQPGYNVTLVHAVLYNSTWQLPKEVGGNPYTSAWTPYSYPDYDEWYWTPLVEGQEPYHAVVVIRTVRT